VRHRRCRGKGCFGDTNDLFGYKGWTARTFGQIAGGPTLSSGIQARFGEEITLSSEIRDRFLAGPIHSFGNPSQLELEHTVVVRLRREAARRQTTLDYLVRSLLGTIADDKLTTAILDDGGDLRRRSRIAAGIERPAAAARPCVGATPRPPECLRAGFLLDTNGTPGHC
jgi:hypothetical protein